MSQTEGLDVVRTTEVAHSDLLITVGCDDVPVSQRHGLSDSREEQALSQLTVADKPLENGTFQHKLQPAK